MFILRKTFDDDTSGIEVNDNGDKYRFQIDGDTAVYVGEDAVPQSVEDEIKNQGYASSVTYDVPGSVKEYVDANAGGGGGGSGTATEIEAPRIGEGKTDIKDPEGDVKAAIQTPPDVDSTEPNRGVSLSTDISSGYPAIPSASVELSERPSNLTDKVFHTVELSALAPGGEEPGESSISIDQETIRIEGSNRQYPIRFATGIVAFRPSCTMRKVPKDVTSISNPVEGMEAYHDGSTGTKGPAFYDGSSWVSLVDGSTI
jgi:hypothetical protein